MMIVVFIFILLVFSSTILSIMGLIYYHLIIDKDWLALSIITIVMMLCVSICTLAYQDIKHIDNKTDIEYNKFLDSCVKNKE